MASSLKKTKVKKVYTHAGALVVSGNSKQLLRRTVMSCLLWEDSFYENGVSVVTRITDLIPQVSPADVYEIAVGARTKYNLRHVPLLIAKISAGIDTHKSMVADLLENIIRRPDELAEFLALYWAEGRCPISNQVKKGLANAFLKFDEYQLAKYNRDKDIKLKDVMFLVHPKPTNNDQEALFTRLVNDELKTPDTWEVNLSVKGADKKEVWTEMLSNNKLGGMALIRNLRNMEEAGVSLSIVKKALVEARSNKMFPYRFIAAAQEALRYESELETMMFKNLEDIDKLPGKTVLLVDVSISMVHATISKRSKMTRQDAACGLAMMVREICEDVEIYAFESNVHHIPSRRGFALRDKLKSYTGGTYIGKAVEHVKAAESDMNRLIIITDEQTSDNVGNPLKGTTGYVLNVASYTNGIGYRNGWTTIDGWSEASLTYIQEIEK
jgi:hypothetical protein